MTEKSKTDAEGDLVSVFIFAVSGRLYIIRTYLKV